MLLHNRIDKRILKEKIRLDNTARTTLSFYRYVHIENPAECRDRLYLDWNELGVMGRIYLAAEGINAQLSIPTVHLQKLRDYLDVDERFRDVPFKRAFRDDGKSFYKLIVRVRNKIVADGLNDYDFDVTNVGKHLDARQFNEAMDLPGTVVVDMRNHYESEVGHFTGAICPDADTFREELPMVLDMLKNAKHQKILLYCTGGIRCEKASAYLKHHGFEDVNQLHGGIIEYAHQIKEQGLPSKFIGKNFVFDERLGEDITPDIISACHQCGLPANTHVNCANPECHLLFIQCTSCQEKMEGCCTPQCLERIHLPADVQAAMRKGLNKKDARNVFKSRLRPRLSHLPGGIQAK
jgi:UPF0176 protein